MPQPAKEHQKWQQFWESQGRKLQEPKRQLTKAHTNEAKDRHPETEEPQANFQAKDFMESQKRARLKVRAKTIKGEKTEQSQRLRRCAEQKQEKKVSWMG